MKLSGISEKVFLDRYAMKDKQGHPIEKSPEDMWQRVARAVAGAEKSSNLRKKYEKDYYEIMTDFKFVPGGRILAGAGTGYDVTYYNCFVIPSPQDSRGGIIDSLKNMVEIMAHGGGVGINLSSLRPRGARVTKVNGTSSGPMNWAGLFSLATRDIIQQGGTRRGALMLMLWDWHPDIYEFITVKQDLTKILGANLSVCVSDAFMEAVEKDGDWDLMFPDTNDPDYDKVWDGDIEVWKKKGKKVRVFKTVKAREMWNLICEAAWRSAEPGVVFMERYNKLHNNYYWNRINCVNPCGEEGLPPWGVCNLGSINLSALVKGDGVDKPGEFDYALLAHITRLGVRFLDNVVSMDPYIFSGIRKTQLEGERRIGLGTMGLGDALIKMHLRYGSAESLHVIDKIYSVIRDNAYDASAEIAKSKGAFGKFDKKLYPDGAYVKTLPAPILNKIKRYGIRNSILTMQAPTGSTSLLAGTTSGIEPVFEFEFTRRDRIGTHVIYHPLWDKYRETHKDNLQITKEGDNERYERPAWFVSSADLTPDEHVDVQSVIQKYVDASISKTVNAPNAYTVDDVNKLYMQAYKKGLKGITMFRDGSREAVLERGNTAANAKSKVEGEKAQIKDQPLIDPSIVPVKPRPMVVSGATYRVETPVGKAYITVNSSSSGDPMEVFINVGKPGADVYAMAEALGRTISMSLRFNTQLAPIERVRKVVEELEGIGGSRTLGFGKNSVKSLPDAVAKVLATHYSLHATHEPHAMIANGNGNGAHVHAQATPVVSTVAAVSASDSHVQVATAVVAHVPKRKVSYDLCGKCGEASLVHEEGCKKCYSCGYSAC
ncbi:MAG TPA: adenosylcobalamin-dependent ribonucleoside-diphosphate reductase [Candidatus Woesebacteria bacterium]|nr:adenosylcobalamin-dependent ribonucleoside-diphosphate reductase [Candidatus Woesebacteria bacterium]HNS94722.1 adenosylcobalamin-dependent ribonucleoside-diphosphate reductase [Candidatus Woesebacteria bacterium]